MPVTTHQRRRSPVWALSICLLVGALSGAARAHHSMAMFDLAQCRTLSGTVRTMVYKYPHSWLWIEVPNGQGATDTWAFEFAAPANLISTDARWSRDVVKKGDKVAVKYSPIKDGRKAGSMAAMTLPNGVTLPIGTPACGGKPPTR